MKENNLAIFFHIRLLGRCPKPHRQTDKEKGAAIMAERNRAIRKEVSFTAEEWKMIESKLLQIGTNNFSMYARKMCIDGYVVKRDFAELKGLTKELANLSRNINQIVKRANETRNIYEDDLRDLQKMYNAAKAKMSEKLVKMIRQ